MKQQYGQTSLTLQWALKKPNMATAISYALDQPRQGRKFILKVPYDLIRWESQQVKALLGKGGIHWNTCDQRKYGANRRKLTCLIFNLEPKMLVPLFTKCNKATGSKEKSTARPFLGRWPRYRQLLAMLLATEADPGDQPVLTVEDGSFLTDVLELGLEEMAAPVARLCSLADFQSLLTSTLKTKQQETGIGLPWPAAFEATTEPMKPHLFKDAPVAKLIKATDQLPPGTELCLHLDRSETVAAFIPLVRYLKQKYLPYQHFTGCSILRGTFGHRTSLLHLDQPSAVFMWKHNSSTNQLYISSAAALLFPPDTFSIREWSVVMFWDEQTTTNKPDPGPDPGPDREDMETDQPSGQPPSGAPPPTGPAPIQSQPVYADPNVPMSPVHSDEDMPDEPPSGPSPPPGFDFPTPEVHMPQTIPNSPPILPQPPEKRVRFSPNKKRKVSFRSHVH